MSSNRYVAVLRRFMDGEEGPTATEYAVMLGLIIVVVLAAVTQIGTQLDGIFRTMVGVFPG